LSIGVKNGYEKENQKIKTEVFSAQKISKNHSLFKILYVANLQKNKNVD
jgi:hypothetical protein